MKQVEKLLGKQVKEVHVDMGYRGHDYQGEAAIHVDKRRRGRTPQSLWRRMKRRAAVEPSIGHLKTEHRLERNRLKGIAGNAVNAVMAAAAMNFRSCSERSTFPYARNLCHPEPTTVPVGLHRLPENLLASLKASFSGSTTVRYKQL